MHSYLKTVGFSQITRRSEIKEIIRDVIASYDEKVCVENHPEGVFVQFSKNYGCDCGISVCGQYDENGEFHVEYYFPFFRGTGITSREKVTVERHTDKESYAGACDDLRIGVTMIFYLQSLYNGIIKISHNVTNYRASETMGFLNTIVYKRSSLAADRFLL